MWTQNSHSISIPRSEKGYLEKLSEGKAKRASTVGLIDSLSNETSLEHQASGIIELFSRTSCNGVMR
ncbi:hypothetical protein MFRU_017g00100 [Monilinia fructicola]|nr:hypothetical protein MFRU_017g00100 [Monilinia fructicola]